MTLSLQAKIKEIQAELKQIYTYNAFAFWEI